ncbi:DUF1571 domain-containing protein [Botrimarina hoheduenensis]|uniref:DUF1571 domain-containing protein n=1 Tax=Botrimarina hoheduenensis TaxID=2528000 RepID=A0A5C5WDU8_9BACT|nr:DUF1571 domain-containing protein [Botrimarina hoheduenensis]TWT48627.1 hypothetical protein Pla111_04020 [Botrimarina hoheduenensis]
MSVYSLTTLARTGTLPLVVCFMAATCVAQQITQPVYRVAGTAQQASPQAAVNRSPLTPAVAIEPFYGSNGIDAQVLPASANAPACPFDLEQRPGEHPLMPCLRLAQQAANDIRTSVSDYSATLTKVERLNGKLGDPQQLEIRIRHQPFSVYTRFISPNQGQEALYVANENNGKLVALGAGWKRNFGKVKLDPDGSMAMDGQRYPITKAGILNLTEELVEIAEADTKYAECTVTHASARIAGRDATMIEAIHPVPRKNFRFHKAQIFIDNEFRMPIAYRAYTWPTQPGGEPLLEEQYVYTNLKINNGFTDADFNPENPNIFR